MLPIQVPLLLSSVLLKLKQLKASPYLSLTDSERFSLAFAPVWVLFVVEEAFSVWIGDRFISRQMFYQRVLV